MTTCDVLVIGGGPAGATCARLLHQAGARVLIADRARFPRDKPCAGWITTQVVQTLGLDLAEYGDGRVLQPFTGFRTGRLGHRSLDSTYPRPVGYGIRRREFDHYLLERSGVRRLEGLNVRRLERAGDTWRVEGDIRTPLIVGAGGHFCPVSRRLNPDPTPGGVVYARQVEYALTPTQASQCRVDPERPRLYFYGDLRGYGWVVRKADVVNVGVGRLDRRLACQSREFLQLLRDRRDAPPGLTENWPGHAYRLYAPGARRLIDDGVVLVGDAAGLAHAASGEGIGPAIESGVLAARAVLAAGGRYRRDELSSYVTQLEDRLRPSRRAASRYVPSFVRAPLAGVVLSNGWLTRRVVLDSWFLHAARQALAAPDFHDTALRTDRTGGQRLAGF